MGQLFRKSAIEKLSSPDQLDKAIVITSHFSWFSLIGVTVIICSVIVWAFSGSIPETISTLGIISEGVETNTIYSEASGKVDVINVKVGETIDKDDVVCIITDSSGNKHDITAKQNGVIASIKIQAKAVVNQGDELLGISPLPVNSKIVVCYIPVTHMQSLSIGMPVKIIPEGVNSQECGNMEGAIINMDSYVTSETNMKKILGSNNDMIEYLTASVPCCAVTCSIKEDSTSENGFYWSNAKGKMLSVPARAVATIRIITDEAPIITKLLPGHETEE